MGSKKVVTGIDIGTTKIAVIIAECSNNVFEKIVGYGEAPSLGLKKGVVESIDLTVKSIHKAVEIAEKQAKIKVNSAYIGITGDHIRSLNNTGVISINNSKSSSTGGKISSKDIEKVLDHAKSISLSSDRRILHVITKDFKVDDRQGIKDPIGLYGHRLEANVHLITLGVNYKKDLKTCLENAGITPASFVLEPYASSLSVLNYDQKELGVILIDIGGGTTDIVVYFRNRIQYSTAIPLGGESVTNDILYKFQIGKEEAEKIKIKHGVAKTALSDENKNFKIRNSIDSKEIEISQKDLSDIIEPRMREIFKFCNNEISKSEINREYTYGIVLTGGGALLKGCSDLAAEIFNISVSIGKPINVKKIKNDLDNPRYATSLGLINFGIQNQDKPINNKNNFSIKMIDKIKNFLNELY